MNPQLIIAAINAGMMLLELATKVGKDLKQSGELSPADEKAIDDKIAHLKEQTWWQVPEGE